MKDSNVRSEGLASLRPVLLSEQKHGNQSSNCSGKSPPNLIRFDTATSKKHPGLPPRTTNHGLPVCGELVLELVALSNGVSSEAILAKKRGVIAVSQARQLVMYLLHTIFCFTYQDIASWMNKDRTTIAHACTVIEDKRDNLEFDRKLERMEAVLQKTLELVYA